MKKTLALLAVSALMTIGCDWLGRQPVINECDKCGNCAAGCCLKGVCDNGECDCACKATTQPVD